MSLYKSASIVSKSLGRRSLVNKRPTFLISSRAIHSTRPPSSTTAAVAVSEDFSHLAATTKRLSIDSSSISPYYNTGNILARIIRILWYLTLFILLLGTALPSKLRQKFGLQGQQPSAIESIQKQADRALKLVRSKHTQLEKYTFMAQLRNTNTRLFYKLVNDHIEVSLLFVCYYIFIHKAEKFLKITVYRNLHRLFIPQQLVKHVKSILIFIPS